MNEKPQVDFTKVLSDAGVPVTEDAVRQQFDAIVKESGLITNTSRRKTCARWSRYRRGRWSRLSALMA